MRGQRSLFDDNFMQQSIRPVEKRTRNVYMPKRNELLLHRFWFHCEINRMRFDDCLIRLEQEFTLTSSRIVKILSDHQSQLNEINRNPPSTKQLQEMYSWINWKPDSGKIRA